MPYYAWQLLRDGLSDVGELRDGQTTSGTTTTIVDTNRPNGEDADLFLNGTAIVTYDAGGAGAAPEGEWSRITSFTTSSKTFNLANTLTSAPAVGDHYVVSTGFFQHIELIRLMNEAVRHHKLGNVIPLADTSITTASNQTEYALPVALKPQDIREIWVQTNTNDADDNRWMALHDWQITWTAAGSTALLILPQIAADRSIRINYLGFHPAITAFNSPISEYLPPELAVALFVERLANAANAKTKNSADPFRIGWDMAQDKLQSAMQRNPIFRPQKSSRLITMGGPTGKTFVPGKVNLGG